MATLIITEFARMVKDADGNVVPVGNIDDPDVTVQRVTYTTSAQSAVLQSTTRLVRVIADADCYLAAGTDPTATTTSTRLEADVAEYFGVQRRGVRNTKLAAYDGTS